MSQLRIRVVVVSIGSMILLGWLSGGLWLGAEDPPGTAEAAPIADFKLVGDSDRGATIYARSCSVCHGARGDGRGKVKLDDLDMPDLTDRITMEMRSDWDLYQVVKVGGVCNSELSDIMPATGNRLSDQDIHDVALYVKQMPAKAYVDRQRNQ
jgi:mono/diheme cytochrome c family protein